MHRADLFIPSDCLGWTRNRRQTWCVPAWWRVLSQQLTSPVTGFWSLDVFARSSFWCRSRQSFGWLDVFARTNFWRRSLDVFTRASIYTPWPDCNTNKTLAQMAFNLNVPVLDLNEPVLEDIGKLASFLASLRPCFLAFRSVSRTCCR